MSINYSFLINFAIFLPINFEIIGGKLSYIIKATSFFDKVLSQVKSSVNPNKRAPSLIVNALSYHGFIEGPFEEKL